MVISRDSDYEIEGFDIDSTFNKVEFTCSGKVWHCIDADRLFDETNRTDPILTDRFNYIFYTNYHFDKEDNEHVTTYSDEELRLLYAIDPYGVADYVQRYADRESGGLEATLAYKDAVFEVLFGRGPKYYEREWDGSGWFETTTTDLRKIVSESELLFGCHPVCDATTPIQFAELIVDIVQCVWEVFVESWLKKWPVAQIVGKVFFGILSAGEAVIKSDLQSYATGAAVDKALEEVFLDWVGKLTTITDGVKSFNDVLETMIVNATYFKKRYKE